MNNLSLRVVGIFFFLFYALTLPFFSPVFFQDYQLTTFLIMVCCVVLSLLFFSGVAPLINILISFYVFKIYLIRPYVDTFLGRLTTGQIEYINFNNNYFNYEDSIVVYSNLLFLLLAWFLGLLLIKPKKYSSNFYPYVFKKFDSIISSLDWRVWSLIILMFLLNLQDPRAMWQGAIEGGGEALFAYGLVQTEVIFFCLLALFVMRKHKKEEAPFVLILPIFFSSLIGIATGGRSALFAVFIFLILYYIYLNFNKSLDRRDLKNIILVTSAAPLVIIGGLAAQIIRPLIRSNLEIDTDLFLGLLIENLNIFDPNNPLVNTAYFGITELLHRLSALQEKFLILGNHYINDPSLTFNFIFTFQRVLNDLMPGSLFPDLLNINQVFHHVYFDEQINYASHMFGIQGTLYLYFGNYLPILLIFFAGVFYRFQEHRIDSLLRISPSFFVFLYFLMSDILENGTLERVIPVDVVRPLTSFLFIILAVRILNVLFPKKKVVT